MQNKKLNIAIVGSSGYTGGELFRILLNHPGVIVTAVTSEKSAGKPITDIFPHLLSLTDLVCEPLVHREESEHCLPGAASRDGAGGGLPTA
jgi:N-acetyl-gamma-glutamyl-phosphate reductase